MKLLLLEQDKDKKGALLEIVVKALLESLGYTNITTNEVSSGGNEIDVYAEKKERTIGGVTTYPLICECKAHENPIKMNDWLKFLGKVYKEKRKNSLSTGLMIALSDANGNVKGDIRESNYQDDVHLLTGQDLIDSIITLFKLAPYAEIVRIVNHWTNLTVTDCDIALFNNTPYWIINFSTGSFSLLNKNGEFIEDALQSPIIAEVSVMSTYTTDRYVDIRKDKMVKIKKMAIKNTSIWALMSGPLSYDQIHDEINRGTGRDLGVDNYEIDKCLRELDFIKLDDGVACLKPVSDIDMVEFYKTILGLGIPTNLYNHFYMENINESLLDKILSIHKTIVLDENEKGIVLFIIKHSPSALRLALYPNALFTPKSKVIGGDKRALQDSLKSMFIQSLAHCLEVDADSDIAMLLFDRLELRDFYKQTIYNVVLKDGKDITIPVAKRLYYIPFEGNDGGVVIQASRDFVGKYDPKTGYMVGGKKKNQDEKTLFGIVKHKTGVDEEYLCLYE